jgi:hypothetical protein
MVDISAGAVAKCCVSGYDMLVPCLILDRLIGLHLRTAFDWKGPFHDRLGHPG